MTNFGSSAIVVVPSRQVVWVIDHVRLRRRRAEFSAGQVYVTGHGLILIASGELCALRANVLNILLMMSAHVEHKNINSVLATIYFISAPSVRTRGAEIK